MQGATWQQAVQWMEERRVQAGDALEVIASHDTYSISFALGSAVGQEQSEEAGPATRPSMHTGMQLKVGMKLPCPRCVALGRHCNFSAAVCRSLTDSSSITMLHGEHSRSLTAACLALMLWPLCLSAHHANPSKHPMCCVWLRPQKIGYPWTGQSIYFQTADPLSIDADQPFLTQLLVLVCFCLPREVASPGVMLSCRMQLMSGCRECRMQPGKPVISSWQK